jgi:hypothetical protein
VTGDGAQPRRTEEEDRERRVPGQHPATPGEASGCKKSGDPDARELRLVQVYTAENEGERDDAERDDAQRIGIVPIGFEPIEQHARS